MYETVRASSLSASIDVRLPRLNGFEGTRLLTRSWPYYPARDCCPVRLQAARLTAGFTMVAYPMGPIGFSEA